MKYIITIVVLLCAVTAYAVSVPGLNPPTPIADRIIESCIWPVLHQRSGNKYERLLKQRLDSTKHCIEAIVRAETK